MSFIRLKYIAEITAGQAPSGDAVTDSGKSLFIQGCAEFGDRHPIANKYCEVASKVAIAGDWLFSVRAPVGRLNEADQRYGIGRGLAAIRAKGVDQVYLGFLLQAYAKGLSAVSTGSTYEAVSSSDIGNMSVPCPDLPTQKRIATFLDSETARIDELIAKKERLVEVLADARFSAISRAVTVGLDEGQPLVDTNSKYIPQVPKGWTVWRLKHLARAFGGITLGRKLDAEEPTVSTPYLRVANVQAGWLDLSYVAEIEATAKERKRYALKAGDILMNEGGDNDKLGRGAVWNAPFGPCITQNHVFFVRPKDTRFSEWISLATNARYARDFFYLHSNQSTNLASVSKTNLERFPVAIPPFEKMQSTLSDLTARLDLMEQTTKATRTSIERLREYRAALITAAVTGQINVDTYGKTGTTSATLDKIEEEMQT